MRADEVGFAIAEIRSKTGKRTDDFRQLLQHLQMVSIDANVARQAKPDGNIGLSLERSVASLCERGLGVSAVEGGWWLMMCLGVEILT